MLYLNYLPFSTTSFINFIVETTVIHFKKIIESTNTSEKERKSFKTQDQKSIKNKLITNVSNKKL